MALGLDEQDLQENSSSFCFPTIFCQMKRVQIL
jgi:hypothetical protein